MCCPLLEYGPGAIFCHSVLCCVVITMIEPAISTALRNTTQIQHISAQQRHMCYIAQKCAAINTTKHKAYGHTSGIMLLVYLVIIDECIAFIHFIKEFIFVINCFFMFKKSNNVLIEDIMITLAEMILTHIDISR